MIKASILVLLGLAAAALWRRQTAATRHWILLMAIACAAMVPALEGIAPAWSLPASFGAGAVTSTAVVQLPGGLREPEVPRAVRASSSAATQLSRFNPGRTLRWVWAVGTAASLLLLLIGIMRLHSLARRAERIDAGPCRSATDSICRSYGIRRRVELLRSDRPLLPVTWGVFRPRILLPSSSAAWPEERTRSVLCHELAHVRRGDWLGVLLAELLRVAYWFNPLVWIACRRLRDESEQACDDMVLSEGVDRRDYAAHLLAIARDVQRRRKWARLPAPAMARPGSFERRVTAVLRRDVNRAPAGRPGRIAAAAAMIAASTILAGFGAATQNFATLSGSVLDPMSRAVPEASVALTSVATQERREVRTDADGRYEFAGLAPGDYVLESRRMGFRPSRENITLAGDATRDLSLALGSLTETISIRDVPGPRPALRDDSGDPPRSRPLESECRASSTGGNVRPPTKIKNVNPVYPANPDGTVQGVVVLEGTIGTSGAIEATEVKSSPHPDLTRAAAEAFERWEFTPTLLNCEPIDVQVTATFHFTAER